MRLHSKYPTLGLDPLHQLVKPLFGASRKRIHKLKKRANIRSIRHKAYKVTTNSKHNNPIAPNLLGRKFKASKPEEAWVSDITYIPTGEGLVATQNRHCCSAMQPGWLYCVIIKDLFTKKIVGYAFSDRINTQLCLDALNMAVFRQKPKQGLIFHSDRDWSRCKVCTAARPCNPGVQYTAKAFRLLLNQKDFRQSMTRKGTCAARPGEADEG